MLFNSFEFIFGFLPVCLIAYFLIARFSPRASLIWIVFASLFFYGWWNPRYLPLIGGSILANFYLGRGIDTWKARYPGGSKVLLLVGIAGNLGVLAYFKYANFLVDTANSIFGGGLGIAEIILPLGISFFTFQKIAYLFDVYYKHGAERSLVNYSAFVLFFPQLIAGPIVHHTEILPQFKSHRARFNWPDMAVGGTIFILGLAKKVLFADNVSALSNAYFGSSAGGTTLTFWEAWLAVLSYTLQIYFDFSGYSDMAIGLGRMFGIKLPLNFASPYKSASIIEFWRRWHMTLSRFLRDYVYIVLGGSRCAPWRRYANLMATMLIGGLWHGAGWTFVVWGGLHGLYLSVNHVWNAWLDARRDTVLGSVFRGRPAVFFGWGVTFLCVMVAWVFFRASTFESAMSVLGSMAGAHGIPLPHAAARLFEATPLVTLLHAGPIHQGLTLGVTSGAAWIGSLLIVALFLPNTQQIMRAFEPALNCEKTHPAKWLSWQPRTAWAIAMAVLFITSLLYISRDNAFLYFQF